jgi:hypothetical protein
MELLEGSYLIVPSVDLRQVGQHGVELLIGKHLVRIAHLLPLHAFIILSKLEFQKLE